MACVRCGTELAEGSRFCVRCGARQRWICAHCAHSNPEDARNCAQCGGARQDDGATPPANHAGVAPAAVDDVLGAPERRPLTVLFCDMVGSTERSTRMDPEDLRDLVRAYHALAAKVVARHRGFVAQYLGDGVLVYFGYPHAREDDAERAVLAGLELIEAIGRTPVAGESLEIRVGIATGLVVVGDMFRAGEATERSAFGETMNLAARLQAMARPNAVVLSASARRSVGSLFECVDLGAVQVKGYAHPVAACEVLRAGAVRNRFEALHDAGRPLVGREREAALLMRCWRDACDGAGHVVTLCGEPGVGKSRLCAWLEQRLVTQVPCATLRYDCSPRGIDSPLHPFLGQLERAVGIDTAPRRLERLGALCANLAPDADAALATAAQALSIPHTAPDAVADPPPARKKALLLALLLAQFDAGAAVQPLLAIFEDAHWIDPSSLELLQRIVERVATRRVLLVVTARPEFVGPWEGLPLATTCALERLSPCDGATMLLQLTSGKPLPAEIADRIVERADGVPLFIEELAKTALESDWLKEHEGRWVLHGPLPELAIPVSLHASLLARLDRIPAAREVAQAGAALGREFDHRLLRAVVGLDEVELQRSLDALSNAGLVHRAGSPPDAVYTFKHALVQDAAYGTLLRSARRQLHARIGAVMEAQFPQSSARSPEVVAQHWAEAQQFARAAERWLAAGRQAVARSANVEALSHLSKGLDAVAALPLGTDRDRLELALQTAIGSPLIAVNGYSAPQTGAAYARARALCEQLGNATSLLAALSGEFTFHIVRGDHRAMRQLVDGPAQTAERLADEGLQLAVWRMQAITAMYEGRLVDARAGFERILAAYEPQRHRPPPVHYVHDPQVSALTYLSLVLWLLGHPQQAQRSRAAALECAAALKQANLTAHVNVYAGAGLSELLDDAAAVRRHADTVVELAEQHSLNYWRWSGLFLHAWSMSSQSAAPANARMREALSMRTELGASWYQIRYLEMLAELHLQQREAESGLQVVAEAKALMARNEELMWAAELARIEGELLKLAGASAEIVDGRLRDALSIARNQSARSLELRAAVSLARWWQDRGRTADAHDVLCATIDALEEELATADLRCARMQLERLNAGDVLR